MLYCYDGATVFIIAINVLCTVDIIIHHLILCIHVLRFVDLEVLFISLLLGIDLHPVMHLHYCDTKSVV